MAAHSTAVNVEVVDLLQQQPAIHNQADQTAPRLGCLGTTISNPFSRILNPWWRPDPAAVGLPHPVIEMIRDKELEKLVLSLGGAVAMALVISDSDKAAKASETFLGHLVVTGLSAGCMAIWNGIVLRGTFRRAALVMEQVGIGMVLMSFIALVASALPVGFMWVPLLCGVLCLFPYFCLIPAAAAPGRADGGIA